VEYLKYIPCPTLCRQCKHFTHNRTASFPYTCHSGSNASAASISKSNRGGGRTFDDCAKFTEKAVSAQAENKPTKENAKQSGNSVKRSSGNAKQRWEENERAYRNWLEAQPCRFFGETGGVTEYRGFVAHKHCAADFFTTEEGQEYLAEIKRQKEQKEKEDAEFNRKISKQEKIGKLVQYVFLPVFLILALQIVFKMNVLVFVTNTIGTVAALGIAYVLYIVIMKLVTNKFDLDFTEITGWLGNLIFCSIVTAVLFLGAFFVLRLLFIFTAQQAGG
jgi:hypothetical protein